MSDRICSTARCGKTNAPHRARTGSGYWCGTCLDHWRRNGTDPAERQALRPVEESCPVVEDGVRCGRPVSVKRTGWCEMHRKLAQNNGSPTVRLRGGRGTLQAFVRAAAAATTDECLIPPGWTPRGNTRPVVRLDGEATSAARQVWTLAHGDPGELDVLHTCNGGSGAHGCINIRHLYLGDATQNARDMVDAERQARGETHGSHVLTEEDVREIRRRHVPGTGPYNRGNSADLAAEYGVDVTAIRKAVRGRTWSHLKRGAPDDAG